MAVTANSIITPQGPKSALVAVTTANTPAATAPVTTVLLLTAGTNGARLTKLYAVPCETVTASTLQVYRSIDAGTTKFLALMQACGSDTVSVTDPGIAVDFGLSDDAPMILQANERLYVATGITKNFNFVAEWGDY